VCAGDEVAAIKCPPSSRASKPPDQHPIITQATIPYPQPAAGSLSSEPPSLRGERRRAGARHPPAGLPGREAPKWHCLPTHPKASHATESLPCSPPHQLTPSSLSLYIYISIYIIHILMCIDIDIDGGWLWVDLWFERLCARRRVLACG
jgi:hypothetical protein